jgi:DNA-binding response OmpR family regulator
MKVLVIDDDDVQRLFLQRLLTKKFSVDVALAKDGIEGLQMVQQESPDLVLLDVMMPFLDGYDVLRAIRADAKYGSLPVVVISCVDQRLLVLKMLKAGVTDYIRKPSQVDVVTRRLTEILAKIKTERPNRLQGQGTPASDNDDRPKLLIVDKDTNFTTIVSQLLSNRFKVLERDTGVEGLKCYLAEHPSIVCLGKGLSLMNEKMLAEKIRKVDEKREVGIYLCAEDEKTNAAEVAGFDGFVKRSFVPDIFLEEFNRVVLGSRNPRAVLSDVITCELGEELISAAQQVLGVMAGEEVSVLGMIEGGTMKCEILATAELVAKPHDVPVVVGLGVSENDFHIVAAKIFNSPIPVKEGAEDALVEVVNTIGGRVRTSLDRRGIRAELVRSGVSRDFAEFPASWEFAVGLKALTGESFSLGMTLGK